MKLKNEYGIIKDIPGIVYLKNTKNNKHHFTLRNVTEKRVSTLKSLGPLKTKNEYINDNNNNIVSNKKSE